MMVLRTLLLLSFLMLTACDLFNGGDTPGRLTGDGGFFGNYVALDGNTAAVAANYDRFGAIFIFERTARGWQQQAKLRPIQSSDAFYLISLDVSGGWLIASFTRGGSGGRVFVYRKENGMWKEFTQLRTVTNGGSDNFGVSAAIDGDRIVVGANADGPFHAAGAVHVFDFDGATWQRTAVLTVEHLTDLDSFGGSVDVSGDRLIVGAVKNRSIGTALGRAYVFERTTEGWIDRAEMMASDNTAPNSFGAHVAIDGDIAVVSRAGSVDGYPQPGAVYVYEAQGLAWQEVSVLTGSGIEAGRAFGGYLSISGDRFISGSEFVDEGRGAAHVFRRTDEGWEEEARLQIERARRSSYFGRRVAVDGSRALVGMPGADGERGAAYVFRREGTQWRLDGE